MEAKKKNTVKLNERWRALWAAESHEIPEAVWWLGGLLLAILLRLSLWGFETYDTRAFFVPWYNSIVNHGRWPSFRLGFSNCAPPYLYLLTLTSYLPFSALHAVKFVSSVFDFFVAFYVMRLVGLRYDNRTVGLAAFMVTLFAPTVFCNSALWGQWDAIYTAFLLGSLLYLFRQNALRSVLFLSLALSCKLQAIFLLPLFGIYYLRGKFPFYYWLALPGVYLVTILPAWLLGRPLRELFTIYFGLAKTYPDLTLNAANFYQWIPQSMVTEWNRGGVVFTGGLLFLLALLVVRSRVALTAELLLKLALTVLLLVPFTLPHMHERYFYAADIVALVYAFYFPRYYYVPVLIGGSSLLSYTTFLYGRPVLNLAYVAMAVLVALIIVTADLLRELYPRAAESGNALS